MANRRVVLAVPLFAVVCAGALMLSADEAKAEARTCSNTYCWGGGSQLCFYVSNRDCNFDLDGDCTTTVCQKT